MEDTRSLLMMVLHKVFKERPQTVEHIFQTIHNYNNHREYKAYGEVLRAICDLVTDKLPSPILVYILTLVELPCKTENLTPLMEKMKKAQDCFPEVNVRPHLVEYLNNLCTVKPNIRQPTVKTVKEKRPKSSKVLQRGRGNKSQIKNSKFTSICLLDICATYVVIKLDELKNMYAEKLGRAWTIINTNKLMGSQLEECYSYVKAMNSKMELIRAIECNNVPAHFIYYEKDMFSKKTNHHMCNLFTLPAEVEKVINDL